ncbi:MAG: hypothetical protein WDM96_01320 [Lacunisphaera sp.]
MQLPNYANNGKPDARDWAQLREAQASAAHAPAVGVAVTIDGDEPTNLHPTNKRPVGQRLAFIALQRIYGQRDVVAAGPALESVVHDGAAVRVRFSDATGLKSTGPTVTGFELAGADKVFHPATAHIEGRDVLVTAADVPAPVAVRYAFTNAPAASLVNAAGLPAAPFRTDDW